MKKVHIVMMVLLLIGFALGENTAVSQSTTPAWTAEINQAGSRFGYDVNSAGDVNGDGYDDIIIGADYYDNDQMDEGAVFVYYGSESGPGPIADWMVEGNQNSGYLGTHAAAGTAGDVNGDGYDDVVIGMWGYDGSLYNQGRAFIYYGSENGLSLSPDWTFDGEHARARLGRSVSTAGDVNCDGYDDIIVGAYYYASSVSGGRVYVFYGSGNGLNATPDWIAEPFSSSFLFGGFVNTAGDINNDGCDDVMIAAPLYTNGQSQEGAAFIYYGSPTGLGTTYDWMLESNNAYAHLGYPMGSAGDVNGDGIGDVIIAAREYSNGESTEGAAYVFHGSKSGLQTAPDWAVESNQVQAFLGISASTAGDFNNDGYDDILIGAYKYDADQVDEGRATIYFGSEFGLGAAPGWVTEGNQTGSAYGVAAELAGDVNGDGGFDIIIGAAEYDNGETNEGRAFLFYGTPLVNSIILPTSPINLENQSAFTVDVIFNHPANAAGEYYTCEFDLDYDGSDFDADVIVDNVTGSSCSAPLNYTQPGAYKVKVAVTNEDGIRGMAITDDFIVIYTLDGGFVAGGGWIWSESGWCQLDATCAEAEGRVVFKFFSKYKKDASMPMGSTTFDFSAGNLDFRSDSFDWLIITQNGTNAQFKGSGTINDHNAPNGEMFKFMLWVADNDTGGDDTFRIKIWFEEGSGSEVVVYDNGFNQPISAGNIKVSDGK